MRAKPHFKETPPGSVRQLVARIRQLADEELRTVPATDLGADAQNANLFNAFRVKISDVSASLLSGPWDPNDSWRAVSLF